MSTVAYVPAPRQAGLLDLICRTMLFVTMLVCVVVPHSFQVATAGLILATFIVCVLDLRRSEWFDRLFICYCAGVVVTAIYLWVGYAHGAPREAVNQIAIVYLLSPLIWLVLSTALMQLIGLIGTVRLLLALSWLAMLSVAAFFFGYLVVGKQAVSFLIEDANVNINDGFAAANLLVYGSLIFLSGAYFADPGIMRSRVGRLLFPGAMVLCAITSGRAALILSIPAGYAIGALLRPRLTPTEVRRGYGATSLIPSLAIGGVAVVVAFAVLSIFFPRVDFTLLLVSFWDKLISGGGELRTEQAAALWEGIEQSYGLGVGHGIGVRYLRSDLFPWRYEIIPLASMLRVGFLGTAVYMSTFLVYGVLLIQRYAQRALTREDIYMSGGFIAVALAVFTNPYIESFIFQWMYFLPVVALGMKRDVAPRPTLAAPVPT